MLSYSEHNEGIFPIIDNPFSYRAIFEASPDAILLLNSAGEFVDCNQAACQMFAYPRSSLLKMRAEDLLLGAPISKPTTSKHRSSAPEIHIESLGLRSDGATFAIEIHTQQIQNNSFQFQIIYIHDKTESKKAEQISFLAERRRVEQLDALRATVADISAELELPKLLKAIVERAVHLINASGGDLGLYNENTHKIHIVVSHNMGADYAGTQMDLGEGAMGLAAQISQPVMIQDYSHWENASEQYRQGSWHAVLAVPILIGERLVGTIGIVDNRSDRKFTASDQYLLSLFAQHAAIAVENARLYDEARRAAERRSILHTASQQIVYASLDAEGIYTAIHNAAARLMPAEAFAITYFDDISQTIQAVYLIDRSGRAPFISMPRSKGLSGRIWDTGQSIYIPDTQQEAPGDHVVHFGDPEQVRSVLAVPMRLADKIVGMLSTQCYQPNAYTPDDLELLEMLASYVAIALDNTHLFSEYQRLAITDPVTEIYNRRHVFELGQREFNRAVRYQRDLAVIMLDLDNFKQVNELYGHAAGDYLLYEFAQFLKNNLRKTDLLGRYGGDEFIIVLPETSIAQTYEMAERILVRIKNQFQKQDISFSVVTVSIGASTLAKETTDFANLVKQADDALMNAKHTGKDRAQIG